MDSEIMVEALPLLGVCNLCLTEGAVKNMLIAHKYQESSEFYMEMLMKCFSIDVTSLDLGDMKRLICDGCIMKLRDSVQFREQVETSLETLETTVKLQKTNQADSSFQELRLQYEGSVTSDHIDYALEEDEKPEMLRPDSSSQQLKIQYEDSATDAFECGFHEGGRPEIKTEVESDTEQCCKRKKRRKLASKKPVKCTKPISFQETETMLTQGLFPFKIRKNKSFSCSICPEESTNLDDIRSHTLQHNSSNLHMALKKMLFSNSQRFYKSGIYLRCKICTIDIKDYDELKAHIENCTRLKCNRNWNSLPFKLEKDQLDCPVCKKTFLNYVSLNTHMNMHYPNHVCENCGKAFASRARLRGHMRTHEVGHFPCSYCPAVFDIVTKRENHVSKEHKSGVRYVCKHCNMSLTSFYARQKHLAEVHNEELKKYKCKACSQSYITPGHLSSHVRRDHLNERNHKCEKCDLAFYTRNALKMHTIKHDGERIHTCGICQKSYQRKKTLTEHMRIHDNDKRFVCPVCGRAFTQKCTLKGHLKVHERL